MRIGVAEHQTLRLKNRGRGDQGADRACNRVEYHVMLGSTMLMRKYLTAKSVRLIDISALRWCRNGVASDETLAESAAQSIMPARSTGCSADRWLLDQGLWRRSDPEGVCAESRQANLDALGVTLDDARSQNDRLRPCRRAKRCAIIRGLYRHDGLEDESFFLFRLPGLRF